MKTRTANKAGATSTGGILCGTDFSAAGEVAADVAASLARKLAVPLTLAHALELPGALAADRKAITWLTTNREEELRRAAALARKSGVTVNEHIADGRADEVLVNVARAEKSRLLVVSSLGRRRPGRWLLGSVAERTAERAATPTLILRNAASLRAWATGRGVLKVFVCFNFTMTAEVALRWVKELMAIGACEVVLGYVNWPIEEHVRIGAKGSLPFDGNPTEVLTVLERDMKARARTLLGGLPVRCRVEAHLGRTDVRLAEMAREEGADLIVVGSHQYEGVQRLWHASVSRGLLSHAVMSVAVVPLATDQGGRMAKVPPLRHVLVSTDFSVLANAAIPYAYALVRGGGLVTLLHVVAPPPNLSMGSGLPDMAAREGPEEPDAADAREVAAKLRALIPAEAADQGVFTQVEIVSSRQPGLAISQTAERLGVDVVCFASHGRSGVASSLFGSVAEEVVKRALRPVFVVRPAPR